MANNKKKKKKKPPAVNKPANAAKSSKPTTNGAADKAPVQAAAKTKSSAPKKTASAPRKKKGLSASAQWALIGAAGLAIIGFFVVLPAISDAADDGGPGVVAAESFDLPVLDDQDNPDNRVRLADFDGRPTVVNFFASWCTACFDELPAFRDAAIELEGEVDFIFVNSNETGNWEPMANDTGIRDLILAQDIQGARRNGLYQSLRGTGGMPITAFYDADGNLVDTAFAPFNEAQLDAALQGLGFIS